MADDFERLKNLAVRRALDAYRQTLVDELAERPPAEIFEGLRKTEHHHRALLIIGPGRALIVRALFVFDDDEKKIAEALEHARRQLGGPLD